jgi:hypothetical protein
MGFGNLNAVFCLIIAVIKKRVTGGACGKKKK